MTMQLTNYTEYALRVLLFLGTLDEGEKQISKKFPLRFPSLSII